MVKVVDFKGQNYDKLKKECAHSTELFTDSLFPPGNESLNLNPESSIRLGNNAVEWKRITEICDTPKLYEKTSKCHGMSDGLIGNGWFISAASAMASRHELWGHAIPNHGNEANPVGIYHFHFWRFGNWLDVCVDDYLPTINNKVVSSHSLNESEFWVSLYEKAFAKICGSYGAMEDFNLLDALSDITSGFPQQISIPVLQESDEERIVSSDVIHIKEIMNNTLAEGSLMCCSILVREPSEQSAITESGLVPVHNYVVTATKEIHLDCTGHQSMFKTGEKILLVRLRHPWGSKEWNGPFSEESLEWTRIEIGERNKLGLVFEEDSEFWMPFEDFISKFDLLTICHIKSHSILPSLHKGRPMWHEAVALGAWTRPNHAGGAYSSIGKDAWLHNPQYRLDVSHPKIELILELVQKEQQLHDGTPHYTKVGFNILKVEENREHRIHKVSNPPIITSDYVQGRNVVWKGDLTKGRYVLIPTTHEPHIAAEFMIRLHSDTEIKLSELIDDYPDPFLNCPPFVTKPVAVTQITVVGATGLAECENTFCIVKVEGESLQSEIVYNSREPQWGLQGIFYRKDVCKPVIVECWESKPQHFDRFLGSAVLSGESDNEMISLKKSLVGKGDKRTELHPGEIEVLIATYDDLMAI